MKRSQELEVMDDLTVPAESLLASLNFMAQVNGLLGGTRTVLDYFEKNAPGEFSVLDVGFGAGDIPHELAMWAKKKGKKITVTAIDLNPLCVAYAQHHYSCPEVRFLQHSAFDIERLGKFDYVISSMFFHHLSDEDIVRLLPLFQQTARRGFLVNDLYRGRLNYAGAFMLGIFSFSPIVFNDAKLSVKRAFQENDFQRYRHSSGISDLKIERKPVFRITMGRHV